MRRKQTNLQRVLLDRLLHWNFRISKPLSTGKARSKSKCVDAQWLLNEDPRANNLGFSVMNVPGRGTCPRPHWICSSTALSMRFAPSRVAGFAAEACYRSSPGDGATYGSVTASIRANAVCNAWSADIQSRNETPSGTPVSPIVKNFSHGAIWLTGLRVSPISCGPCK